MATPCDLLIVALDAQSGGHVRPVEPGDLSLALAGAELIDLLDAEAVRLEGESVVPGYRPTIADPLLDEAASSLDGQPPYESVDDWLWRRGRGLAAAYLTRFETEGRLVRRHPRWLPFRTGHAEPADTADRRLAADRLAAHEPVLTALATAAGIGGGREGDDAAAFGEATSGEPPTVTDDTTATVLAAVHDAVEELAAVRQRRAVEQAAFDNIWRGDGT